MTIKQCLKLKSWNIEISGSLKKCQSINVSFINESGREDEAQFDICGACTERGKEELAELYHNFCRENKIPENTVTLVSVVAAADTMEELEKLEGIN